ncbi:MAG: integrase domain-containing protein [Thermodesulfovibrionales bacterium]
MNKLTYDVLEKLKNNRDGSFSTQAKRRDVLVRMCKLLSAKYPGLILKNLKRRHIIYVLEQWKNHKSIKTELSHVRWLLKKIEKEFLLPSDNKTLGIPHRSIVAKENKSWLNKVDIMQKFDEVSKIDETAGLILKLCLLFGVRMKEASLFRPHENIKVDYIEVHYGTKGGRKRTVPVLTDEQRNFLKELKDKIAPGRSLLPGSWSFVQFKNRFYYVASKCGISRKNKITVHGLRHTYACLKYRKLTSFDPPVLKNEHCKPEDKEKDMEARGRIARELGHGRIGITSAYLGGRR